MTARASSSAATPNVSTSGNMLTSCGWMCGTSDSCACAAVAANKTDIESKVFISYSSSNRIVHGDELGAVREGRFDLDVVDHLSNAVHHLGAGDDVRAQVMDGIAEMI